MLFSALELSTDMPARLYSRSRHLGANTRKIEGKLEKRGW